MGLPAILPYQMPTAADLPVNKLSWTPDPKRAVLLIHDVQQHFINAFTPGASPLVELIANIQALKNSCEQLGIPVIYTAQPGGQTPEQRGLQLDLWGEGIKGGPEHQKIIDELEPTVDDIRLTKWRYSAFQKTELRELLRRLGRDQMIITGVYAHIGCMLTAAEAFMQEVQAFYVADAVADFSLEDHKMALNYVAKRCGVTMMTEDVLSKLNGQAEEGLTLEALRAEIAEMLDESPDDLPDDEDLINSRGLDSVRIMSLIERWRQQGREVTFVQLAERPTLADWYQLLTGR